MPHILVIEDDDSLRLMLEMALKHNGHRATLAENGRVGVERFLADPPDLVITDIIMPEQEGVETIIELRKQQPQIKIIAMSGGGPRSEMYLKMCAKLGVCSTLAKPFTLDTLLESVNEALSREPDPA